MIEIKEFVSIIVNLKAEVINDKILIQVQVNMAKNYI